MATPEEYSEEKTGATSTGNPPHLEHVLTLMGSFLTLLLLDVELAEEVEGDDSVQVHDDTQQHYCQYQLCIKQNNCVSNFNFRLVYHYTE